MRRGFLQPKTKAPPAPPKDDILREMLAPPNDDVLRGMPAPPNDDILREILIRLPAESLIRSRAVCKRWRAIIDAPPFARAHQHQPINKSIIVLQSDPSSTCYSLNLESLSFRNGHQTISATPLGFTGQSLWTLYGACKGLVLTYKPLEIWNPSTHERLDLHFDEGENGHVAAFGLGYDYVTDDYKVVSIFSTNPHRTDVYSLKSDTWRTITNCPLCPKGVGVFGVFVGGALNWISSEAGSNDVATNNKIVALDLGTEKYTLLQMPRKRRDGQFGNGYSTVLDVLNGCLILCDSNSEMELDVWVMKDYGDEGSWIKLFSIDQKSGSSGGTCLRPVGFVWRKEEDKMRQQVFLDQDTLNFFLYDVKTKTKKRVFVEGHHADFYSQHMFPGTKFCLRDNCGGGARRKTSGTTSSANKNSANKEKRFVFSVNEMSNDGWGDGKVTYAMFY